MVAKPMGPRPLAGAAVVPYINPAPPRPEINPELSGVNEVEVMWGSKYATPPAFKVRPPLRAMLPPSGLLKVWQPRSSVRGIVPITCAEPELLTIPAVLGAVAP